ncbi:MAG: NAD/NADP octopine/nopaline dehydrogenase family protein [Bacillota bacterium]
MHLCSPYRDEARLLAEGIRAGKGLRAQGAGVDATCIPQLVTSDPALAVSGAHIVLMVAPAFAHDSLLHAVVPHLEPGAYLGVMPARSGFEFAAGHHLTAAGRHDVTIFGFNTLPWACRIASYGQLVEIHGVKDEVALAASPPGPASSLARFFQEALGIRVAILPDFTALTLANMGQVIHPGIMYGLFLHNTGVSYEEDRVPPFYQSVDDQIAAILEAMSREVLDVARALKEITGGRLAGSGIVGVREWLLSSYSGQIEDTSSLARAFATNRAYRGLPVPSIPGPGGQRQPDFQSRYLTEDVPYGLVVVRGLADLYRVPVPVITGVISVTSGWMGREYLLNGRLEGRDVVASRCPQRYGIDDMAALISAVTRQQQLGEVIAHG